MATFDLNIMTPEHEYFSGKAESLTVNMPDGSITILAGHMPLVTAVEVGEISFRTETETRTAVTTNGFMEVSPTGVDLFVMSCESPEDIDVARADRAAKRAQERLRQKHSLMEYKATQIALSRAMARLKASHKRMK